MKQIYSIAGLTVEMDTTGRTLRQAAPYLSEHPDGPKVELRYDPQGYIDLYPELSSENAEYIATGRSFYRRLLDHDGFMLHSSCVVMDGKAYCFTATSGTGKSTHTALWQKVFGRDRVYILNDDKPALRRMDGRWYAFGTPWSGKYDISVPKGVPLGGIALLSRGETNSIEPLAGKQAVVALFSQSGRFRTMEARQLLFDHLNRLLAEVPVWHLKCNMDEEAAILSHRVMAGENTVLEVNHED